MVSTKELKDRAIYDNAVHRKTEENKKWKKVLSDVEWNRERRRVGRLETIRRVKSVSSREVLRGVTSWLKLMNCSRVPIWWVDAATVRKARRGHGR